MPGNMHAGIKAMEARFRKYMQQGNKAAAEEYLLTDFADTTEYLSTLSTDNSINVCMDSTITFIRYVIKAIKRMHEGIQPLKEYHFGGTRHWQNQHFFHRSRKRRGGGSEEKLCLLWKWRGLMAILVILIGLWFIKFEISRIHPHRQPKYEPRENVFFNVFGKKKLKIFHYSRSKFWYIISVY